MSSASDSDLESLDASGSLEESYDSYETDDELCNIEILKSMKNEMELFWKDGDLFDITLEVDGQLIHAHKLILASHSPYFKAMFCGQFQDAKKRSIELKGVYILSRATFPGAPSYGGVRTWVEGSQARGNRTLAEASNLLGYRLYPCLEQ